MDKCAGERAEYGYNTYSGRRNNVHGLAIMREVFSDQETAAEFLDRHALKGEDAVAVRLRTPATPFNKAQPKRWQALHAEANAAEKASADAPREALTQILSQASKLRRCHNCGSSIAVAHLRSLNCPVCGKSEFCASPAMIAKLKRLAEKAIGARQRIADEQVAYNAKAISKMVWLIGVCVPE